MFAFRYFCKGVLRDMLLVQTGGFRGGSEVQGQACMSQAFDCKVALRRKAALSSKKSCFHPQCRLRSPERRKDQCSSEQLPAAGDELSSIVWLPEAAGAQNRVLRPFPEATVLGSCRILEEPGLFEEFTPQAKAKNCDFCWVIVGMLSATSHAERYSYTFASYLA